MTMAGSDHSRHGGSTPGLKGFTMVSNKDMSSLQIHGKNLGKN